MEELPNVVIIELGSQYTLKIEQTLRELCVRSVVLDPKRARTWIERHPPKAIILSGSDKSVYDKDAPMPPEEIFMLHRRLGRTVPILGICYGMQWLVHRLGGEVRTGTREYGHASIEAAWDFMFEKTPKAQPVWMSHGDSVVRLPNGFAAVAHSDSGAIAAARNGSMWGVQFHPEVTHTRYGRQILQNFLSFSQCTPDWSPHSLADSIRRKTIDQLGEHRAIFGFSGGVDSTTLAAVLSPALRRQIRAVTIDGGHLREHELGEIRAHAKAAGVEHSVIDARAACARALCDVTDAEEKRRRFKRLYAHILAEAGRDFGATAILQGTLAPDRIESGATGGAVIKSHHNVGLDFGTFEQVHPIDHLFKYEVRALAKEIGLPQSVWSRQPFPGPGLFLRVLGTPATPEKLALVRWADARVTEILKGHGLFDGISQLVVAYAELPTVGVKGDARVYKGSIIVRAVRTVDFMTAEGVWFPEAVVHEISRTLTAHPEVVRAWFDPTSKPPGTTEME